MSQITICISDCEIEALEKLIGTKITTLDMLEYAIHFMLADYNSKQSRISTNPDPIWYTEHWYISDLENALNENEIDPSQTNVEKLLKECRTIFDDKSSKNEALSDMVYFMNNRGEFNSDANKGKVFEDLKCKN